MKTKIIFIMILTLMFTTTLVSAYTELSIQSITIEEPVSDVISNEDFISIKAIIANTGASDLNSPFWVKYHINNKIYGSCSDNCELIEGTPVSQGLKAGQSGEFYISIDAGNEEWLSIGENEVKIVVGIEGESKTNEKSFKFVIEENTPKKSKGLIGKFFDWLKNLFS
jgi:hypothetical protein